MQHPSAFLSELLCHREGLRGSFKITSLHRAHAVCHPQMCQQRRNVLLGPHGKLMIAALLVAHRTAAFGQPQVLDIGEKLPARSLLRGVITFDGEDLIDERHMK